MIRLIVAMTMALALTVGCKEAREAPRAETVEEAVEEPTVVRELTPEERTARYQAELEVVSAIDSGAMAALRGSERAVREATVEPPSEIDRPDTTRMTILFGGNNHGEREDCGCRKNPLGGLARRHTMLNALTGDDAVEIWGAAGAAAGPVFHLDAGDGLYRNATLDRGPPNAQKIARHDAVAIVRALNEYPPDAYLAGEIDFAFGPDELKSLEKTARFPLISANIVDESGELLLPPSVVVERDGVKLGVVGVTKSNVRWKSFWEDRGLAANDPFDSAKAAIEELPSDVSLVVLLSNLGLPATTKLIRELVEHDVRVHFAAVSGTNRMTSEPEFASGVPVMEPLSRGKYLGRADFLLNGDEIEYRNAATVTPSTLRNYRRAIRSYWSTRKGILREKQKIAELEKSLEKVNEQATESGPATAELIRRRNDAIDAQKKRLKPLQNRLQAVSRELLDSLDEIDPGAADSEGDDWVTGMVVPVKVEFPEERATRRVLDRFEKRRPKEEPRRR